HTLSPPDSIARPLERSRCAGEDIISRPEIIPSSPAEITIPPAARIVLSEAENTATRRANTLRSEAGRTTWQVGPMPQSSAEATIPQVELILLSSADTMSMCRE